MKNNISIETQYNYATTPMVVNLNYSQCVDEKSTVTCIDCIQQKISTCAVGDNIFLTILLLTV